MNGNTNTDGPLLTFQSMNLNESVNDICWSPDNSTFFASCMGDGRVELWDLTENLLDPIVAFYPDNNRTRRTCVRYCFSDFFSIPVVLIVVVVVVVVVVLYINN